MTLRDYAESRPDELGRSTSLLLHHLATCDICQQFGTRYCDDIESIIAVVRHDRLHPRSDQRRRLIP